MDPVGSARSQAQYRGMERYSRIDKVGEGTYGIVYKARDRVNGNIVALKKIRLDAEDEGIPSTAIREISILRELNHENVVSYVFPHLYCVSTHFVESLLDVAQQDNKLCLVFEFLDQDLKRYLENNQNMSSLQVKVIFCRTVPYPLTYP